MVLRSAIKKKGAVMVALETRLTEEEATALAEELPAFEAMVKHAVLSVDAPEPLLSALGKLLAAVNLRMEPFDVVVGGAVGGAVGGQSN
jgi:hypothetical protein